MGNCKMDDLLHYGTPRHSGRYPWGSGKNPQRNKNFVSYVNEMRKEGLSDAKIAKVLIGPDANSTQLRAKLSIATNEVRKENIDRANRLRNEKGYGPSEIGRIMNQPESTIRSWLKGEAAQKKNKIQTTAEILKKNVDEKGYIDIGKGVELSLNTTATNLSTAVAALEEQGYVKTNVQVQQQGTAQGMKTTVKVLAPPGTTYKDVNMNKDKIRTIEDYTSDSANEISRLGLPPLNSVKSDRVMVRFDEDGGRDRDGVIQLRRGVEDLSLGNAKYAQVRIAVDDTHYMKGMAIYGDDKEFPPGIDIIYNSNKSRSKGKLGAMKELKMKDGKPDPENPFGASIKLEKQLQRVPRKYLDAQGKEHISPINVVSEEGNWQEWSKNLASQMLSKQPYKLVKRQLELSYDMKKAEFAEIMAVDNPVVRKKLLEGFQSDCDSLAVHLKAASFPRQATHVILPLPDIKENEIFAPRYHDGEKVALVRYPHGGTFEIPILTVNNKNKSGREYIGTDSPDAVGIHPSAAVKLSGADFDGDTVIVIPTSDEINIKNRELLPGLRGFDEQKEALYKVDRPEKGTPEYEKSLNKIPPVVKGSRTEQMLMGKTTNLITDMTLKGANDDELARAVRHSMVVIDAAKHDLDWRQSEKDNGIKELKKIYQAKDNGEAGGVSTIISRAKSPVKINRREVDKKAAGNSMGWDPVTGEILWTDKKGDTYIDEKGKVKNRQEETTRMEQTNNAMSLVSEFRMPTEIAYANYANGLKSLANEARKAYLATDTPKADPAATKAYSAEVASLNNKLKIALMNSPRERQAQLYADHTIEMAKQAIYPEKMDKDVMQKKRAQALAAGRAKFNAQKDPVKFTEKEWEAVQARAISPSKLSQLLANADMDQVKKLATPRQSRGLLPAQESVAKSMAARGYTLEEIADKFGVSSSTISKIVSK